jgi:hypothetical protein
MDKRELKSMLQDLLPNAVDLAEHPLPSPEPVMRHQSFLWGERGERLNDSQKELLQRQSENIACYKIAEAENGTSLEVWFYKRSER